MSEPIIYDEYNLEKNICKETYGKVLYIIIKGSNIPYATKEKRTKKLKITIILDFL